MYQIRTLYQTVIVLIKQGSNWWRQLFDHWAGLGLPILLAMLGSTILNGRSPFAEILQNTSKAATASVVNTPLPISAPSEVDPVQLLEKGLKHVQAIRDYQGTFVFQYREGDRMREPAVCSFRFRAQPFSVAMEWLKGAGRIDKLLYVAGKNQNKMLVHPTGLSGALIGSISVDPNIAASNSPYARPITQFGLENNLQRILKEWRNTGATELTETEILDHNLLYGKEVITLRKENSRGTVVVDLDKQSCLLQRIQTYDSGGRLLSHYEYRDLQFNKGFD